ncbi:hypothetical protein [Aeromicrobium sp. UC242_57]|uniref:hypothetical protein n=1 Tax=Aeromicrobium sp. UC242_57 TaxID=3374624 RepID=UPI00379082CD
MTQDDKAFAVVLTGQFQSNARPCYAQRKTLMLDATLVANDQKLFDELAPYLWSRASPSTPASPRPTSTPCRPKASSRVARGRHRGC